MATAPRLDPYPHIEKTEGVRAGKACVVGTRIAVVDIAIAHEQGHTPEEIQTLFSSRPLTLAEVHGALTYHYDHPEELASYNERGEKILLQVEAAQAEYLRRKAER